MFDRFIIQPKVREEHHHSGIFTVNHHHAPTDESVKLLNEFQEKAINNIISKFEVKSNIIDAVAIATYEEFTGEKILHIRFKLNGKDYKFTETFSYSDTRLQSKQELGKIVVTRISETITSELIKESEKDWMQFFFRDATWTKQ